MTLPVLPPRRPRPVPLSLRLSKEAAEQLKTLAAEHNMTRAAVIELLVAAEFEKKHPGNHGRKLKPR